VDHRGDLSVPLFLSGRRLSICGAASEQAGAAAQAWQRQALLD
jgi:hypothetical protein